MAATYFLVRIIPSELVAADVFQDALSNITITAFDKTVRTAGTDREIGSAKGLAPGPNPNDNPPTVPPLELLSNPPRLATSILQHRRRNLVGVFQGLSVATAVIVVKQEHLTGTTPEYPTATSFDIRLQISLTSGTGNPRPVVRDQVVDFNIKTVTRGLSAVQNDYTRAGTDIFLTIDVPDEPLPSGTTVLFPNRDGKPPSFEVLRNAIDDVLEKDHPDGAGSVQDMTRFLSTAECQQIASELVNNRILDPPPAAPYPTSDTNGSNPSIIFEDLFTAGTVTDADDRKLRDLDRQKFDGARTSYYALHSADALQLANHVFTLVAAVQAEKYTAQQGRMATIDAPLKEGISHSSARSALQLSLTGSVVPPATDVQALNPPFIVPAPFIYALTTSYATSQAFETRIKVLLTSSADALADLMRQAIDAGVLHPMDPSGFVFEHSILSTTPATNITQHQAIRRLVALQPFVETTTTDRFVELGGNIDLADLVAMWLDFMGSDEALLEGFWRPRFASRQYLVAILESIAPNREDLIGGIFEFLPKPGGGPIATVDDLLQISEQMWLSFFGAHEELLPPRYVLGDLAARVHSFVVDIAKVLSVPPGTVPPETHAPGGIPHLNGTSDRDVLVQFFNSFTAFSLSSPFDDAMRQQVYEAALGLFGNSMEIASFVAAAVEELWTLYRVTELGLTPRLRFSLMESLHARGFTTVGRILELPEASFTKALVGTVAYQTAPDIYQLAEGLPWGPDDDDTPPGKGFQPINSGSLAECIPPHHLSPFGPIQYLHDILELSDGSSTIRGAVKTRRGDLGGLLVTSANEEFALTTVDIVNENLEAFALGLDEKASDWLVHNTLDNGLTELDIPDTDPLRVPESLSATDLLRALPQHSAPHAPAGPNNIYKRLKTEIIRPELPYSQGLDIGRTYLKALGTSRFETLRTFQKEITEMPQGLALEPTGFQRNVWRLPVRKEIAIEYLCMSLEEAEIIFGGEMSTQKALQLLGIRGGRLPAATTICQVTFFLQVTGLSYCEFLDLHKSGIATFWPDTSSETIHEFPPCLPCCADGVRMKWGSSAAFGEFLKTVIFARLWKGLQGRCQGGVDMSTLADICKVLRLFNEGNVNPGFLVQLSSLLMLKEMWCLPWNHPDTSTSDATQVNTQPPHQRTPLLALWAGTAASEGQRRWAIETIIDAVEKYSISSYHCPKRPDSWRKIEHSLDDLAKLTGFDGTRYRWDSQPTCTIRFVEILSKLYASNFTVGEILFLFTNKPHLRGDDPYPNTEEDESLDDPLNAPEDDLKHGLWSLRRRLLDVRAPNDEEACCWTWARIEATLGEMGFGEQWDCYGSSLGNHFFPEILEDEGWAVLPNSRRFEAQLPVGSTNAALWTRAGDCSPFHIEMGGEEQPPTLWARLPLRDQDVLGALRDLRQLNEKEQSAVQRLYLAPRVALAPLAFLFENFGHASEYMVQESCVYKRWRFFQGVFDRFVRRCHVIASHIHAAVVAATQLDSAECICEREEVKGECESECPGSKVAWEILLRLTADGNRAQTDWEDDAGFAPTTFDVPAQLTGGAFAALLGLTGTGLFGEYTGSYGGPSWTETRGGLAGWGSPNNHWNSPLVTVLPRLNIVASSGQSVFVSFKNGFALDQDTGDALGGAEPFQVTWSGALLVEKGGCYHFAIHCPEHLGDDNGSCYCEESKQWSVTLQRGQKMWCVLEQGFDQDRLNSSSPHNTRDTPARYSRSIALRHGAYDITVKFRQPEPNFDDADDLHRFHTGLDLKYMGPDTANRFITVPQTNLYLKGRSGRLGNDDCKKHESYEGMVSDRYLTSLRDARRTFQRAFKAVLFAHRFCLSACPSAGEWETELGYLLSHADKFTGVTYYLDGQCDFRVHRADLNFDLLPVSDAYLPPDASVDQRVSPSSKRSAALFDWFERIFDYVRLRRWVRQVGEPPVWRLFSHVDEDLRQPVEQLVRFLDIDLALASLALEFFEPPHGVWHLSDGDNISALADERWTTRVWLAGRYLERLKKYFYAPVSELARCRPALWAASPDGNAVVDGTTGNANLTRFVQRSALSQTNSPPRLHLIITLNDGLRLRARAALLALLAAYNYPTSDLNDQLLMDVEAGLNETATRIDDAIAAVQRFMQRVILGLEGTTFLPGKSLLQRWECEFSSFEKWQAAQRRKWYYENWVHWEEAAKLAKSEGFQSLKKSLRADVSTLSSPGRGQYLPQPSFPAVPGKRSIPGVQSFTVSTQYGARDEGLRIIGTPDYSASPTWLTTAPALARKLPLPGNDDEPQNPDLAKLTPLTASSKGAESALGILLPGAEALDHIPIWIQAAVRLGTRFIRVAASGVPVAARYLNNTTAANVGPCCVCKTDHAPVMDEYYFWLEDARHYDPADAPAPQNADLHENVPGVTNNGIDPRTREADPTSDWDAPTRPMLAWKSQPLVHLRWTKVHMGLLLDPRRSTEGIPLTRENELATLFLDLTGRAFDSLHFSLFAGGDVTKGFRYDMATDSAVVVPEAIVSTDPPDLPLPTPLQTALAAFPYFLYFNPGAPLMPVETFATALVVAASLRADCKFEEASSWLRLTFDPLGMDNSWSLCEKQAAAVVPNRPEGATEEAEEAEDPSLLHDDTNLFAISLANEANEAVAAPARTGCDTPHVPCCPSAPAKPARARGRAATLEYLETLLEWSNALRCQNSLQASQRALTLLAVVERVLGPKPARINARDNTGGSMTIGAFEPYAAPLNPRLMELYYRAGDALESLRASLNKKRLGNGELGRDLAHFGSHARFDGEGTNHDGADECGSSCCFSCCHPYRFTTVLPKALQWASLAKSTAGALQTAIEKADGEALSSLRLAQERQMTELGLEVSKNAYRAADWDVQALDKQMAHATTRLQYFQRLIERGLNTGEIAHVAATSASMGSRTSATVVDGVGQGMASVPDMWVGVAGVAGSPLQFNQMPMGVKLGTGFATAARILNTVADISGTSAGLSLTQAGWERREDEWQHSCDLTVLEIQQIKRQRLAARRRLDTALRDLDNTQRRIEHSAEVHDFSRDKASRYELYLYLQQENAALYRQLFDLALATAREAQQALRFELGDMTISCLPDSLAFWDSLHQGLLAGEELELALCAMERAHMSKHCREYELTKHISLRLHFPAAFVLLKATGYCQVDLPEWLFDLDYPGHYMRRIKAVSLTVPCVAGPYTGVHCKLQQLSSAIRFRPARVRSDTCKCCPAKKRKEAVKTERSPGSNNNNFPAAPCPNDPHLWHRHAGTEAIATSTGQADSGLFELAFADQRYLPFEYSGAVSRWRIELPPENNQFDFDSLSDLVLHINYTAREGGDEFARESSAAAQRFLPGNGWRFFDVRHELPEVWNVVRREPSCERCAWKEDLSGDECECEDQGTCRWRGRENRDNSCEEGEEYGGTGASDDKCKCNRNHGADGHRCGRKRERDRDCESRYKKRDKKKKRRPAHATREFRLALTRDRFPFLTGRRSVAVTSVHLLVDVKACSLRTAKVRFKPPPTSHAREGKDYVDTEDIPLVPAEGGMLKGGLVLKTSVWLDDRGCEGPMGKEDGFVGTFSLPCELRGVRSAWILCGYRAEGKEDCETVAIGCCKEVR